MRRTSKPAKYERKTVIFGDAAEDETDNTSHFLGIVRKTLREALEGLFAASEVWLQTV
ncbi:hypothetical protein DPMN_149367 [Dreissena polymorpha]|uniref:Uncharacterized protein n=1 Tax=Dreissena polymorpha TaxID=45954 RepID=A0A9D4FFQ8_DREPO|nr:hypothetical protein DPMN_149367 [Dreissena polymorpha]